MSTPLERLLAEELPTGSFGDVPRRAPAPARPPEAAPDRPPDPAAAAHRAALLADLARPRPTVRQRTRRPHRHLRAVPSAA